MVELVRFDSCWCGSGRKNKACHMGIDDKIYRYELEGHIVRKGNILKIQKQIQGIREGRVINMAVLDAVGEMIGPGVSTQQIDDVVTEVTARMGGIAAPLNNEGFPKSVCTSINEVVCH